MSDPSPSFALPTTALPSILPHIPPPLTITPALPRPEGAFAPGTLLAQRYEIVGLIGRGGFGETYLAHDRALPVLRECVVKRIALRDDLSAEHVAALRASITQEATLLSALNTPGHPHIPEIYDYLAEQSCFVMKSVAGESLGSLTRRNGAPLDLADLLRYTHDICSALVYLHERGVIHHDIKPDNILVDVRRRAWLIDFGIGAIGVADARGTVHSHPAGMSPGYAPPEQLRGQTEPRSDVYALAATLFYLLTRQSPPLTGAPPPLRSLRPELNPMIEALLERATAAEPTQRPTSSVLLLELRQLCHGIGMPPPSPLPEHGTFVGRSAELAAWQARLATHGVAALVGMAGLGKTALAVALAQRCTPLGGRFWHRVAANEGGACSCVASPSS